MVHGHKKKRGGSEQAPSRFQGIQLAPRKIHREKTKAAGCQRESSKAAKN